MSNIKSKGPQPAPNILKLRAYSVSKPPAPTDLKLDANEGQSPPLSLLEGLAENGPELFCRYIGMRSLEEILAQRLNVDPDRVVVTAGGDDAIDRACRVYLQPDREMILPTPTFEIFDTFARLSGGRVINVPWPDEAPYPVDQVLEATTDRTGLIVVISPNNPTGAAAAPEALRRLSAGAPDALILVDLAYGAFADEDLMPTLVDLPNVLAVHTLSKTLGMAGLRVGWAVGSRKIVKHLRVAAGPYMVSNVSRVLAEKWLREGQDQVDAFLDRVRQERDELTRLLAELGGRPLPSQANFVFARFSDPLWIRDALAGLGIAVRLIDSIDGFDGGLRITCPGEPASFDRLEHALRSTLAPQALLLDMDGVLADVSGSYRASIVATAATYGQEIHPHEITAIKTEGNANDDWEITRRLLEKHGVFADYEQVKERFEAIYQGEPGRAGLRETEKLIPDAALLSRLAQRLPLGIVTGRPQADARRFLEKFGIADLFGVIVSMDDAPLKPDPAPVKLALDRLGVKRAWMVGDTPDDVRSARSAGVVPIGVVTAYDDTSQSSQALFSAGAARVLTGLEPLEELLP